MRIVVFGAGAVGGVIGGRLFQYASVHGHDVTLVARGAHHDAIRDHGLTINDPSGSVTLPVPVVDRVDAVPLVAGDVVILTMKSQDTAPALEALAGHAPAGVDVACAQNGVDNERQALRLFPDVYAICVMLPASYLEPGIVDARGAPHNAILDLGRYPIGADATADALSAALEASGLSSRVDPAVMRLKYAKLLLNLSNPLDALVGRGDEIRGLYQRARAEAEACFEAAGIDVASPDEDHARRWGVMESRPIPGRERAGSSTWQSFARGQRTTEVDWLNGEIVLLGRLHGVPTPVNAALQAAARHAARAGVAARSMTAAELEP
jgi:2-dehydropantoate 2-reductase